MAQSWPYELTISVDPHPSGGWNVSTSKKGYGVEWFPTKRQAVSDARAMARYLVQNGDVTVAHVLVEGDWLVSQPVGR